MASLVCLPCILSVLAVFVIRTHLRTLVWENGDTLFINDGYAQINSAKTQFNLGITYMMRQEYDLAIAALVRCARAGEAYFTRFECSFQIP